MKHSVYSANYNRSYSVVAASCQTIIGHYEPSLLYAEAGRSKRLKLSKTLQHYMASYLRIGLANFNRQEGHIIRTDSP